MRVVSFLFAGVSLIPQGLVAQGIKRDGPDWVRIIPGSVSVNPHLNLWVQSQGSVVVRGVESDQIRYTLTQRARAVLGAEAGRQSLSGGAVDIAPFSGGMHVAARGSSPNVSTELELDVPRQMRTARIDVDFGGRIEVHDFNGSVQVGTPAGEIVLDGVQGSVSAKSGGGRIRLGKIGGAVECLTLADSIAIESAGGRVNCQTAGGEIVLKEAGGPVWLSSEGGNITVGHAAGSVEAHAASGLIEVGQAGGTVIADTRAGSIKVGSARGVRAESAQGAVRLTGMSGPMNVTTAMGNILAELVAGMALQDSTLTAVSGDITVFIPSNLRISVMATNDNGSAPRIISDFSEIHTQSIGFVRAPSMVMGAINGGGPVLHIDTGRGLIYLKRLK